jgi:protein phosphatase
LPPVPRQSREPCDGCALALPGYRLRHLPAALSRFLDGRTDGRSPDLTTWELQPGDRFLLCSAGLSCYVPETLIHLALTGPDRADDVADQLIRLAVDHGGPDNVTVVVLDITSTGDDGLIVDG